jgi:hypothetical protein
LTRRRFSWKREHTGNQDKAKNKFAKQNRKATLKNIPSLKLQRQQEHLMGTWDFAHETESGTVRPAARKELAGALSEGDRELPERE